MRPFHRRQTGFTLIELMIVVAIIAILAAIAVPQYQDYMIRTQVSEGLETVAGAKTAIWEFRTNRGYFPKSNESAGLPSATSIAGKYVSSIKLLETGKVEIAYEQGDANDNLHGKTVVLSPIDNGGSIGWTCSSSAANRYLPATCRSN
ncbi:type IV pilus assembly protein PilA [Luteibacter sp. 621]|jgi:type IV pilus assembly protein PilA|uniref:pilin n=1 Tax=Luteibacter sp. 621 TaxID=3373916 RepID=UPI003D24D70F